MINFKALLRKEWFLQLTSITLLVGVLITTYLVYEESKILSQRKLISATKVGQVILLKDIIKIKPKYVYILYPYQYKIHEKTPQSERINYYLNSINYQGDEGLWSLVFVDDNKVSIATFKRSIQLDIWSRKINVQERQQYIIPANLQSASWAEVNQAAVFRFYRYNKEHQEGRYYLIFGRIKR